MDRKGQRRTGIAAIVLGGLMEKLPEGAGKGGVIAKAAIEADLRERQIAFEHTCL